MKVNKDDKGEIFQFESTNRVFNTYYSDGISISEQGEVRYGYDGTVEIIDSNGDPDFELTFTKEEKLELAIYMIEKWKKWGGVIN